MRGFVTGFLVALLAVAGGIGFYIASGRAPAAVADQPLPLEETIAELALDAHIERQQAKDPAVPADEGNLAAGAHVYRNNCAGCHSLPGQMQPALGSRMYPPAPQLFKGIGVTDDPVFETYWKVVNGIRLTGMPAFGKSLSDAEIWQVSQLVAHADRLPDPVRTLLAPGGR